jgi:Na+-translocating ferredoxin:NAD+ oxidoreductase subunit B
VDSQSRSRCATWNAREVIFMSTVSPEQIDAILPQTQCGLCGYSGCMPYAEALAHENAAINLCPPGGVKGLREIANLMNKDASPYLNEMEKNAKPKLIAVIREAECIGCTKCIQACPVDAILGSGKSMHTIIASECTGCELCVSPCPVDCIDMRVIPDTTDEEEKQIAALARKRFYAREERLEQEKFQKSAPNRSLNFQDTSLADRKSFIEQAIQRAKIKKPS